MLKVRMIKTKSPMVGHNYGLMFTARLKGFNYATLSFKLGKYTIQLFNKKGK